MQFSVKAPEVQCPVPKMKNAQVQMTLPEPTDSELLLGVLLNAGAPLT